METAFFGHDGGKRVIVFIGLQASGKSTFFERCLGPDIYEHVNLDTLRTRAREAQVISSCFEQERSFAVDNTNPTRADRQRYIVQAKEHGYEVVGIYFKSVLRECIDRNAGRERQVPSHAIASTQKKLEMPCYDEGFDQLFYASIMPDGSFSLTKWTS